tara:strand:+ start:8099 stop:10282 length:2184 start_codon:yes stop_codon:yes gene_type:complete
MVFKVVSNTRYGTKRDFVKEITDNVPHHVQIDSLKSAYPNGRIVRNDFYLGSLEGEAGESLRINIDPSSPNFMQGMDFATGEGVGGITKILMHRYGWKLPEVVDHFSDYIQQEKRAPVENPIKPNISQDSPDQQQEESKQKVRIDINTPHDSEYLYLSELGEILFTVRKYLDRDNTGEIIRGSDGKPKKEFRQFPSLGEKIRPLYNLPQLQDSERIVFVEGEKCADALTRLGYTATCTIGGAGMLSAKSKGKYDFSPFKGKELIIWPDNDNAGKKHAKMVQELAQDAGVKSVTMLTPPFGKPDKWDAADAVEDGTDIAKFLNNPTHEVKKTLSLSDPHLLVENQFVGSAPEQKFLIGDTIPLGVPVVFAASGDSGKGMMTLDLAMKVASGEGMQSSFGGLVATHGSAVILSAEDDRDELHRRVSRLDPMNKRSGYEHKLIVVPLPNEGGVFPIMLKQDSSYLIDQTFDRIYREMKEIDDLALIVIDPMASFVHADVNADPAAGAAFMGFLAQMATETGATVIVNHHMAKVKENDPITTPEQARNFIRGTSAIVDGVRSAFAVWQVEEKTARTRCKDLNLPFVRNAVFDGAVVKSNGPAKRDIRHFIRNPNTGLLEDKSVDLANVGASAVQRNRLEYVFAFIRDREDRGIPVTKGGAVDGIYAQIQSAPVDDINAGNLSGLGETTIKNAVTKLQNEGRVDGFKRTRNGPRKWLGVVGGVLSNDEEALD